MLINVRSLKKHNANVLTYDDRVEDVFMILEDLLHQSAVCCRPVDEPKAHEPLLPLS